MPARPDQRQPRSPGNAERPRAARASFAHYLAKPLLDSGPLLFGAAVIAVLYASWLDRNEGHLTPENGVGYWLGITGGVMMLTLMLYPLRKRLRFLRFLGKVPSWFRWHMILGIVGPSLILIHSNWKLASLNATVATMAMLIVAGSGIIGRYFYSKVHMGLYGRKTEVRQILADATLLKEALGGNLPQMTRVLDELRSFETRVLAPRHGFLSQTAAFLTLGFRRASLRGRLLHLTKAAIAEEGKRRGWSWSERRRRQKRVRQHLGLYFAAVTKAARFSVYDRLLALWHVLHLPLFFLLVAAAIIHVIAVHLY
jgi:hypothetical protein